MDTHPGADATGSTAAAARNLEDSRLARDPNLRVIFAVTLIAVMGVSSLTPAFPEVSRALGVSSRRVGLLISVFTVPGVLLAPVLGVLADRWGRKRVLVPSLLLFALAGSACALARDFQLLLGLRLLQGVGSAALGALNMTILSDLYTGHTRTTAMGYNSSVLSVGTASYPAIGGALTGIAWYAPFLLPLAGLPVAFLVAFRLETRERVVQIGLRQHLAETVAAARHRQVVSAFLASTFAFIVIFGPYLAFLPILMDRRFAASPLAIGLLFSLGSLSSAVAASRLGQVSRHIPETRLVGERDGHPFAVHLADGARFRRATGRDPCGKRERVEAGPDIGPVDRQRVAGAWGTRRGLPGNRGPIDGCGVVHDPGDALVSPRPGALSSGRSNRLPRRSGLASAT
jgi:MFS family permease